MTLVVSMRMQNGALCRFDFSWRTAYGQDERIEIHGEKGLLTSSQPPVGSVVQPDGKIQKPGNILTTWQDRFAETYKMELDAFLSVLVTGEPHPVLASLRDGLMAQRIGEAAKASATEGAMIQFNS